MCYLTFSSSHLRVKFITWRWKEPHKVILFLSNTSQIHSNQRESNTFAGALLSFYDGEKRYIYQLFGVNWYTGNSLLISYYTVVCRRSKFVWEQLVLQTLIYSDSIFDMLQSDYLALGLVWQFSCDLRRLLQTQTKKCFEFVYRESRRCWLTSSSVLHSTDSSCQHFHS